jgi:uracil-DNA glycosylase family 4
MIEQELLAWRQREIEKLWQKCQQNRTFLREQTNGYMSTTLVPGVGNLMPRVMLIGEAPGRNEDREGKPFVGAAGKVLDGVLADVGLARDECWITNVVKFRPIWAEPSYRTGKLVVRNRTPDGDEIFAGRILLREEVRIIAPAVIVPLGATALRCVDYGANAGLLRRGEVLDLHGYRWAPTYHPAATLYGRGREGRIYQDMVKHLKAAL